MHLNNRESANNYQLRGFVSHKYRCQSTSTFIKVNCTFPILSHYTLFPTKFESANDSKFRRSFLKISRDVFGQNSSFFVQVHHLNQL